MIGKRLRELREVTGLSQSDIVRRAGVQPAFLSRIENDHISPSIATIERIASAIGVSLRDVFHPGTEYQRAVKRAHGMLKGYQEKELLRHFVALGLRERQIILSLARKLHLLKAREGKNRSSCGDDLRGV